MASANWMVACTTSTGRMLGSTWRQVMLARPWPQARAASTYSRAHTALADARVMRAKVGRSEEHTSELQSHLNLVCRLLLEKKKTVLNDNRVISISPCPHLQEHRVGT